MTENEKVDSQRSMLGESSPSKGRSGLPALLAGVTGLGLLGLGAAYAYTVKMYLATVEYVEKSSSFVSPDRFRLAAGSASESAERITTVAWYAGIWVGLCGIVMVLIDVLSAPPPEPGPKSGDFRQRKPSRPLAWLVTVACAALALWVYNDSSKYRWWILLSVQWAVPLASTLIALRGTVRPGPTKLPTSLVTAVLALSVWSFGLARTCWNWNQLGSFVWDLGGERAATPEELVKMYAYRPTPSLMWVAPLLVVLVSLAWSWTGTRAKPTYPSRAGWWLVAGALLNLFGLAALENRVRADLAQYGAGGTTVDHLIKYTQKLRPWAVSRDDGKIFARPPCDGDPPADERCAPLPSPR
ncbi:MAG: hypothetical protein IPK82_36260 [Polyangiaceae bacterium]|nr:hypothetical protein [Polyangiaceae bacterium]